jgi:hypothetical protein
MCTVSQYFRGATPQPGEWDDAHWIDAFASPDTIVGYPGLSWTQLAGGVSGPWADRCCVGCADLVYRSTE